MVPVAAAVKPILCESPLSVLVVGWQRESCGHDYDLEPESGRLKRQELMI